MKRIADSTQKGMTPQELIAFFETSPDFEKVDTDTFVPTRVVPKIGYYNKGRHELYFVQITKGSDPLLQTFNYDEATKDVRVGYLERLSQLEIFEGRLAIRTLQFFS